MSMKEAILHTALETIATSAHLSGRTLAGIAEGALRGDLNASGPSCEASTVEPVPAITSTPSKDPWVHRSTGMRCSSCMWFVEKLSTVARDGCIGRCRRHAPTMNGYPVVFSTDWCGDHKLDEGKV